MKFCHKTMQYLKEMDAVLIESKYKIFDINFHAMQAYVNKQDVYRKRNGKLCTVEHHFGRWITFAKDDVKYGKENYTTIDSSIYGLEEVKRTRTRKYLDKETKIRIIAEYKNTLQIKT